MRRDVIIQRLLERPFRPFLVRLTDGRSIEIRHPEAALVTTHTLAVGVPDPEADDPRYCSDLALISLTHVVQIDPVSSLPTNPTQRNIDPPEDFAA